MDIITLALAKKYANKVAAGFSSVSVEDNKIIFTLNDGKTAEMTVPAPANGKDGISITNVEIDDENNLLCTLSNGETINAGKLPIGSSDNGSLEQVQSDWSQNDETQPSYIKNRPFYESTTATNIINPTKTVTLEVISEGDGINFTAYDYTTEELERINTLSDGEGTIKLTINGKVIETPVTISNKQFSVNNLMINDMFDDLIMISINQSRINFGHMLGIGNHNFDVSLSIVAPGKVVKIDAKYLPDTVAMSEDLNDYALKTDVVQPDWNQNDETAPDYIKNRICYEEKKYTSLYKETKHFQKTVYNNKEYYILYTFVWDILREMTPGTTYEICFNNIIRNGIAKNVNNWDENNYNYAYMNIGNDFLIPAISTDWFNNNYQDTGEDFALCVGQADVAGDTGFVIAAEALYPNGDSPEEVDIEIDFRTSKTHIFKLDYKYMPFRDEETFAEVFNDTENNPIGGAYSHIEGSHTESYDYVSVLYSEDNTITTIDEDLREVRFSDDRGFRGQLWKDLNDGILYIYSYEDNAYLRLGFVWGDDDDHAGGFSVSGDTPLSTMFSVGQKLSSIDFKRLKKVGACASYSHVEGKDNYIKEDAISSHAEGKNNAIYYGESNHIEGYSNTIDYGRFIHVEGEYNDVGGDCSHVEGNANSVRGSHSHMEGINNHIYGDYTHVEGRYNQGGNYGHVEGQHNAAFNGGHAEGGFYKSSDYAYNYLKVGEFVITEIDDSDMTLYFDNSVYTLSEEYQGLLVSTKTSGQINDPGAIISRIIRNRCMLTPTNNNSAYPEFNVGDTVYIYAYQACATGSYSHSEGKGTITISDSQHVQGKFNQIDTQGTYAHIIGGGYNESSRRNIHTVDWNGNAIYSGKVTIGATPTNDMDVTTKQYVDETIATAIGTALEGSY